MAYPSLGAPLVTALHRTYARNRVGTRPSATGYRGVGKLPRVIRPKREARDFGGGIVSTEVSFALVVAGDHVRADYVALLGRLGLSSASFGRARDAAAWLNGQVPA